MYSKLSEKDIAYFKSIVGEDNIYTDTESLEEHSKDETENLRYIPEMVITPLTSSHISEIVKYCNLKKIPITPRGGGTGLSGGALPQYSGVVLSIKKMNNIIDIDTDNLQVTCEAGVITEDLQNAVKEKNLFYPPDPSSKGSCFIGGNIAENSGGPKAVKYGVVKDYVLNLEVVLPTGEIIWTGANVLKNSTGYNLTQLMVGSEGTLGIVTKIVLKLIPFPKHDLLILAPFKDLNNACLAVSAIFKAGYTPSCLELMEIDAIHITSKFVENNPSIPTGEGIEAHLIIEVDGNDMDMLYKDIEGISEVIAQYDSEEIFFADNEQQKTELWKLRRRVAEAVKANGYTIEEDTVVPRANIPKLIRSIKQISKQRGIHTVCYGHAGDGNIHIRIKHPKYANSYKNKDIEPILKDIFKVVEHLGGTISGEHGIGLIQQSFLPIVMSEKQMDIQTNIKRIFDPNHILNPDKIFSIK